MTDADDVAGSMVRPMCPTGPVPYRHQHGPARPRRRGGAMSEHPNVTVINRMTKAVFENDRTALAEVFADDLVFHVRGALPRPGDHQGVDGFLGAMGAIFELTDGD